MSQTGQRARDRLARHIAEHNERHKNMMPQNYNQAHALIEQADKLFRRAALAWERGNNNASVPGAYANGMKQCDKLRSQAEALLAPLGIECDYPGLYPSFKVNGYDEHSTQNAVSSALGNFTELKKK